MNTNEDTIYTEDISMMQLADSFFPTGMYTMSNGLEILFYDKRIDSVDELKDLLIVLLKQQIGPADCVALGNAYQASKELDINKLIEIDNTLFAIKVIKEIREAAIRSGIQLLKCLNYMVDNSYCPILKLYDQEIKAKKANGVYAVALAVASNIFNLSKYKAGLILLYSFSISVIGAALRLGMLNHFQGQKVLHELKPSMVNIVKANINKPMTSIWQFAPEMDIIQMRHERLVTKMFIT